MPYDSFTSQVNNVIFHAPLTKKRLIINLPRSFNKEEIKIIKGAWKITLLT